MDEEIVSNNGDNEQLLQSSQSVEKATQDLLDYFLEKDKKEQEQAKKEEIQQKKESDQLAKEEKIQASEEKKQEELQVKKEKELAEEIQQDKELEIEYKETVLDNLTTMNETTQNGNAEIIDLMSQMIVNQEEIILQEKTASMADDVVSLYGTMIIPILFVIWLISKFIKPFT